MKEPEIVESWKRKIWNHDHLDFNNPPSFLRKDWDSLVLKGKTEPESIFVMLEITADNTSSHDMAIWTDDNISGLFPYRDWTKSSLPFIEKGETYWSGFTFQLIEDAKLFVDQFGGNGNWMSDHEAFVEKINKKRNE